MLFTVNNAKTIKGEKHGWLTAVLYMLPHDLAGLGVNVCPRSTPECRETCLVTAGRGVFRSVQRARWERTRMYAEDRLTFTEEAIGEIIVLHEKARKKGMRLAVRVNGTSDLPSLARKIAWHAPRDARMYDYTKIPNAWHKSGLIHYTFSHSEHNENDCLNALRDGINVAVVFSTRRGQPLPATHTLGGYSYRVIDGDAHDLRFLDPKGVIVGLRAKGKARTLKTDGFVIQV